MYKEPNGQDQEADVVVVGTGPGGLAAVGSAVAAGAEVVSIEAHDRLGGNGLLSTGWVAFVDCALQREQGIEDSVELFLEDCEKLVKESGEVWGLAWDKDLTRLFAQESSKMYDILTERGVKFPRLIKRPLQTSVDRLAAVEDTNMFAAAFEPDFAGPHVSTYLRCSVDRLIVVDGAVKGVRVQPRDGSRPFTVRARKGVVLAAGGFQANPKLRRHFQSDIGPMGVYPGLDTCRGDMHLLGQAIGGDLVNMTMIPPLVAVPSHLTEEAIAVNAKGKRFHDEAGPYGARVAALKKQDQRRGHYIYDANTFSRKRQYVDMVPPPRVKANTLRELAAKIKVPGEALEQSVREWNEFLATGETKDPATGRVQFEPSRRPISEAPFYSNPMVVGVSLSVGGFVTTASMQVVDVFGNPIPGLFAVGDCAGGLTPTAEMGGTHLGGGFVLGWVAGQAIVTGKLAAPHKKGTFGQHVSKSNQSDIRMPVINAGQAVPTARL